MKETVMAIAKNAKTYDEFVDAIYAIPDLFIDDDDTVFYNANNGRTYTYDVSEYIAKMS